MPRAARPSRIARAPSYLEQLTGKSHRYWVAWVERQIRRTITPNPRDPKHPCCDPRQWLQTLQQTLEQYRPSTPHDVNLFYTAALSQILALWYLRVQRAKAYDPRRPVKLRRQALQRWQHYAESLMRLVVDEQDDARSFPGQDWDPPFAPRAKNGTFV